ncbi:MAG: thermonuclease family protein [Rhodospirillales bacterium]
MKRLALLFLVSCLALPLRAEDVVEVAQVETPTVLALADGRRLRLAGLEGPLPQHEGLTAAGRRALIDLLEGDALLLPAEGQRLDRLDRALAQAFRQSDGLWLQAWLLRHGFARVDPFTAPPGRRLELYAAEAEARRTGKGIWSHRAYALRDSAPESLLPWIGSLQVLEGQVLKTGKGRGDLYLNFGEDRASDTTARIARRHLRVFAEAGFDRERLEGATLRLRGWIQSWNGPFVELHSPAQIELLAEAEPKLPP